MNKPYIITFPKIGSSDLGYISVAENENIPFIAKRVYWTYFTPEEVERGGHAHLELEQVLVAVAGTIRIEIETLKGERFQFNLEKPNIGVFIPKLCWRTMKYSHNAVQMCIASQEYKKSDYIRDYNIFKNI